MRAATNRPAQLDRDFETGQYGEGIYLYQKDKYRTIIEGISYEGNKLIVKDKTTGNNIMIIQRHFIFILLHPN